MPYQLNTKQLFLTYPQCNVSKEDVRDFLIQLIPTITEYVVAHEHHANGDDHIHCYLKMSVEYRTRDPKSLDILHNGITFHGNYQGCRSTKNVIKYCSKAEDYVSNMDLSTILGKTAGRRELGRRIIDENLDLSKLVEEYPELIFGYKKLKSDIEQYRYDAKDQRDSLPTWLPNPWGKILASKLSKKQRHYWIYSDKPNLGKTRYFAKPLFDNYRCGLQCGDVSYWLLGGSEECVILDEYNTALLKYSQLNAMADGSFAYRIFQGGLIRLRDPLIIVLSNQPIVNLYPHMYELVEARFKEIKLD